MFSSHTRITEKFSYYIPILFTVFYLHINIVTETEALTLNGAVIVNESDTANKAIYNVRRVVRECLVAHRSIAGGCWQLQHLYYT